LCNLWLQGVCYYLTGRAYAFLDTSALAKTEKRAESEKTNVTVLKLKCQDEKITNSPFPYFDSPHLKAKVTEQGGKQNFGHGKNRLFANQLLSVLHMYMAAGRSGYGNCQM
jgi:hypothetical protein